MTARTNPRTLRVTVEVPLELLERFARQSAQGRGPWAVSVSLGAEGLGVREATPPTHHAVSWRRYARAVIERALRLALSRWGAESDAPDAALQDATFGRVKYEYRPRGRRFTEGDE